MAELGWYFGALCLLGAGLALWWQHRRTRRLLGQLEQMLDAALDGSFTESRFDESQLSALEARFAQYLSASEASGRSLAREKDQIKTLISDISHQTKTPLANLLLYSELLGEEELPEPARDNLAALHAQAEKLRFLIDALVKLSRLENGILTLTPRPQPLAPLLEQVARQFAPQAEQKGLALRWEETDCAAVYDRKWTAEALGNLVDNAVKYTPQGSVTLSATAYPLFVRIDVADTGTGIAEEEQPKIFARFYRSESVRAQEGVGVGLYLARQIAAGEGGYLRVRSRVGQGTVFSLFLPRAE